MKHDLIQLAEQYPGLTISVSLDDLLTAGRTLADELLDSIVQTHDERPAPAKEEDELLTIVNTEQEEALTISNTEQENVAYTINNDAEMDRSETAAVSDTENQANIQPTQTPEQGNGELSLSNTAENK